MVTSIVRDRIANLTLDDVLKNRNKLRSGVKEEMQKILTGWGLWLETIEIQDVRILSASLFKNLQTEFREKSRLDAQRITNDINTKIKKEQIQRDFEQDKKEIVNTVEKQKIQLEDQLTAKKRDLNEFKKENQIAVNKSKMSYDYKTKSNDQTTQKNIANAKQIHLSALSNKDLEIETIKDKAQIYAADFEKDKQQK